MFLKQSTSVDVPIGPFLDETDGKTAETSLTITQPDVRLKKNAGNWAQKNAAQTLSHEENGWYEVTLDATDTDTLGHLVVAVHESGALPVWREFLVVPAAVYDAMVSGSGNGVRADVQALAAGAITASAVATGAIDADALAADAAAELADAVWDEARSGHVTAGTFGEYVNANLTHTKGTAVYNEDGTLASATSTTVTFPATNSAGSSVPNDARYEYGVFRLTEGTGFEQVILTTTRVGSTREFNVLSGTMPVTPGNDTKYVWEGTWRGNLEQWRGSQPNALSSGRVDSSTGAMAADVVTASALAADAVNEIADGLLDRSAGVETNRTVRQALRLVLAALVGKLSGAATTTVTVRDTNDGVDRIVATVDASGNRSAVTLDAS